MENEIKNCDESYNKYIPKYVRFESTYKTEYRNEYKSNPILNNANIHELAVPNQKFILSKELQERANSLMPKHIQTNSTYRSDFKQATDPQIHTELSGGNIISSEAKLISTDISPAQSGYKKYLDIYATTNKLDYSHHSLPDYEKSVHGHDIMTVYDWLKIPKRRGTKIKVDMSNCRRDLDVVAKLSNQIRTATDENRRVSFSVPRVPNRGLISEHQEQFSNKNLSLGNPTNL